jgi:hypothetical protein
MKQGDEAGSGTEASALREEVRQLKAMVTDLVAEVQHVRVRLEGEIAARQSLERSFGRMTKL